MQRKLALIPIDGRPVTRDLPCQIARIGGWEVLVPEKNQLGLLKIRANIDGLLEWVFKVSPAVDGFVISADMIGYGGLVPSRISTDSEELIRTRLNVLKKLKELYPDKKIMVFSATMRISNNYVNEEEKEYWAEYGEEIWSYSYHSHRYEKTSSEESKKIVEKLSSCIPDAILKDYLATREKNFNVNLGLLTLVEEGIIDVLVYPQDDTSEYGFNIREQEQLSKEVMERSLFSKVFIYPGADEVANTLVSRLIYLLEGVKAPTFYPFFSGEKGALVSAMYEDRPIVESVKGQIYAFGSHTVEFANEADIVFAVNVPGKRQGDLALRKFLEEVDTADRNIGEWISRINYYLSKGKKVAVADVAYANGADQAMMDRLLDGVSLSDLSGFGAWNTAGNTIGTVVAQAAMVHLQSVKLNVDMEEVKSRLQDQLVLRMLEDYVYQCHVRQVVRASVDENMIGKAELLDKVNTAFQAQARMFLEKLSLDYVVDVFLPWDRTFEIGLAVKRGSKHE
jgi:hypothetical protein